MDEFLSFAVKHWPLFAALGVLVLAFIANEVHGHVAGGKKLSPQQAVRLINDRDPIIVDVRPSAEFKRGHLLHAQSLPIAQLDTQSGQLDKNKTRPVLVYCALGAHSGGAAEKLRKLGYAEVYPLSGGLNNWQSSNLPITAK